MKKLTAKQQELYNRLAKGEDLIYDRTDNHFKEDNENGCLCKKIYSATIRIVHNELLKNGYKRIDLNEYRCMMDSYSYRYKEVTQ